ncbi:MAG: hypothetical protein KUL86_06755 [Castellaniella sp.]|nr:hypothetical protein [Castellaniella sp.]
MSAFCVFGMTEPLARAMAAKKSPPPKKGNQRLTPEEVEAWRASETERIFTKGKARQISSPFSAPQFCEDWIALANRTTRAARLKVMVRDTKVDKTGAVVLNKKTKRPVMTWRAWQ